MLSCHLDWLFWIFISTFCYIGPLFPNYQSHSIEHKDGVTRSNSLWWCTKSLVNWLFTCVAIEVLEEQKEWRTYKEHQWGCGQRPFEGLVSDRRISNNSKV